MALTDLAIVRRSMSGRMFSTVTTVLTVAVAVGLLLVLLAMQSSAGSAFARGTGNAELLITRESDKLVSVLNSMFYRSAPRGPIPWRDYEQLTGSYPLAWTVPTQLGDSYRGLSVMATTPAFFSAFQPAEDAAFRLARGELFDEPFELVVGAEAARIAALSVGDQIHLWHGTPRSPGGHEHDEFTFRVVGVLEPTRTAHDRTIFCDLTGSWTLHAHDRRVASMGAGVVTTPDDLVDADRLITGIYAGMGPRKAALPQILDMLDRDPAWTVANPAGEVANLFAIVGNVGAILKGMAVAVMVSSGIAIMLALYNSMEQRRRQIAVLRVLGASRGRIFALVMTESAVLGLGGAIVGLVLAFGAGQIVSEVMAARLGLVIQPVLDLRETLVVIIGAILLACVAGVVPAVMGYRTSVVRNLRPIG